MNNSEIIKGWKDNEYRDELGTGVNLLPNHPAGWSLSDSELKEIFGGDDDLAMAQNVGTESAYTFGGCCHTIAPSCISWACSVGVFTIGCC
jgi:mersacidin/lichenicidin family type 2 lantibiotic